MRTLLLGFLVFLLWAIGCRYWYVCKIKNHCGQKVEVVEDVRAKTLRLVDKDKTILENYDHFRFDANSAVPVLNDNNKSFIEQVAKYLKENPGKTLTVVGHYLESEKDISIGFHENIGIARADQIRKLLMAQGITENRMLLDAQMVTGDGTNLSQPVSFRLAGDDAELVANNNGGTPDEYDNNNPVGGQAFSFTNMSFSDANFDFNSAVFKPGPAFIAYADSVKIYLSENDEKFLKLTGHTCDIGGDDANLKLGKARARSVRDYFRNLGVKTNIETNSEGETNPAYSNETEATKSKNRRVVVQIK